MYYHLHSFYQNHKRYVRSRNDAQLAGKTTAPGVKCQPEQFLGGNAAQPINPCGLIAWSLFNDSFTATVSSAAGARSTPLNLNVRVPLRKMTCRAMPVMLHRCQPPTPPVPSVLSCLLRRSTGRPAQAQALPS